MAVEDPRVGTQISALCEYDGRVTADYRRHPVLTSVKTGEKMIKLVCNKCGCTISLSEPMTAEKLEIAERMKELSQQYPHAEPESIHRAAAYLQEFKDRPVEEREYANVFIAKSLQD